MITNIIFGFVIPWIYGIYLYKKSPIIVWLFCPISAAISALINDIGYHLEFWDFTPLIQNDETLSALPLDLGLYPVLASSLIYWITKNKRHPLLKIAVICFLTSVLEYVGHVFGKVKYGNNWNIGWTFCSYLLAFGLVYLYYKLLLRYGVLKKIKQQKQ